MTRRALVSLWLGFALAALFFYPLAAALDANLYYLQWQARDTAEAVAALAILAVVLSGIIFAVWPRSTRLATVVLIAVAALPLASLAAGVSRELPYDDAMRAAWEHRVLRVSGPALIAAALALAFVLRPGAFGRWVRRTLVLMSPISLVVVGALATSASRASSVLQFERVHAASADADACTPVLALLFDELSFSYLYDEAGNIRPEFPAIGRLGSQATHYLSVTAPGRETLSSMPSFLAGRRIENMRVESGRLMEVADGRLIPFSAAEPDGLFATARALGFRPEMAGYYLAYCDLLAAVVDGCHSLSFYNVSSSDEEFSPVDPVLTTLVLWPRQFPFGLLKNPSFAVHQREIVEDLMAFARRPMRGARPVFRFVHFSVPHLPFVFDAEGYNPPFDPLQTAPDVAYARQLQYVDRLVGELVERLGSDDAYEGITVALLADHGFRFGGRERDPLHIPFMVKRTRQQKRANVTSPLHGERLLMEVVEGACRTAYAAGEG